jgi:hypothetical protein
MLEQVTRQVATAGDGTAEKDEKKPVAGLGNSKPTR